MPPHDPEKKPEENPEQNIDELEKLAYMIAEEFVRETELQLADALLKDKTLRAAEPSPAPPAKLKRRTAGS